MEYRVAVVGIIIENSMAVDPLNSILHEYAAYIIGRMGIPHRIRGLNIISIIIDAPPSVISALSGKIGRLEGVTAKATYSSHVFPE